MNEGLPCATTVAAARHGCKYHAPQSRAVQIDPKCKHEPLVKEGKKRLPDRNLVCVNGEDFFATGGTSRRAAINEELTIADIFVGTELQDARRTSRYILRSTFRYPVLCEKGRPSYVWGLLEGLQSSRLGGFTPETATRSQTLSLVSTIYIGVPKPIRNDRTPK